MCGESAGAHLCEDPSAMATPDDARIALLSRLIDHAPLFPPASLSLPDALAEDVRARESPNAFMLGRFVCPASRLRELSDVDRGVSVVLDGVLADDPRVEAVETLPSFDPGAGIPDVPEVYVEIPLDDALDHRLAAIRRYGLRAKVRCSGAPARLGRFLRECRAQGIVYKATAGLHHAVSTDGEYGFLNILAAAVFADEDAIYERDAQRFAVSPSGFRWGSRVARVDEVAHARRVRLHSIGSCSFFEPVEELEALGMLPL